jgi:hypothetical protein
MHRFCCLTLALTFLPGLLRPAVADDAAEIKALIPAASAMSLADFDKLATSETGPDPAAVEDKTLTLMLLALRVQEGEAAKTQFRFLGAEGAYPPPQKLAQEITRFVRRVGGVRVATGPVTMIQSDRITDCTSRVDGDQATGTVSFRVPDLYEGQVDYVARRREGKWRIEEFSMKAYGVHIVRGEDGKWKQKASGGR